MNDITIDELKERLDSDETLNIIDVREIYESEEFNIGGTLIPLATLPSKLEELERLKNEEVIIYCRSGGRSANAKMFLIQNGFSHVRNLLGGMMAWQNKFKD